MFDTYKTHKELASVFAPSGNEAALTNRIIELAKPYADECRGDALGNLIVRKKGGGRRVMLSAHMDSVALVVTHIDDNGFLRFCTAGNIAVSEIVGNGVMFERGVKGVVNREEKCKIGDVKANNCYIDIGADSRDTAQKYVNVGDMAVFYAETYTSCNRIISPRLSGLMGCVIMLKVLSMAHNPVNDLYFTFTTQKELGIRGAKTAAFGVEPALALAADTVAAGDTPETEVHTDCALGKGAAVILRDNSLMAHTSVVKWLDNAANEAKLQVQRIVAGGRTDAGAIHVSRAGVPSGVVGIPVRYPRSSAEMADLFDIENATRLILAAVNMKVEV